MDDPSRDYSVVQRCDARTNSRSGLFPAVLYVIDERLSVYRAEAKCTFARKAEFDLSHLNIRFRCSG